MKRRFAVAFAGLPALSAARAEFVGPGAPVSLTRAADVATAGDKTPVRLEGWLSRQLDDEHYEFRDDSGTVRVEIERERLPAAKITPQTRLRLSGEVDRDWMRREVEVSRVELIGR